MLVSIPQNYAFLFTSPQFAYKKISNKTLIDVKRHILRLSSSESAKKSATLNKMQNSRKTVIVLTILRLFYHKSGNFLSFLCHALRPLSC